METGHRKQIVCVDVIIREVTILLSALNMDATVNQIWKIVPVILRYVHLITFYHQVYVKSCVIAE